MFKRIAIAVGDSPSSAEVVANGLDLAEKFAGRVLLLHVFNPLVPHGFSQVSSPLVGGILPIIDDAQIERYLVQWQAHEKQSMVTLQSHATTATNRGINVEVLQDYGDAGPLICRTAKTWGADTIVMGRNQKSTLDEIFLGSVSNYVLHHAHCSTIVVRSTNES